MRKYIEQNLTTGEKIEYQTHLHWMAFIRSILFFLLFLLIALDRNSRSGALFFAFVSAVFIAAGIINKALSEFGVTNKRVIMKNGVLSRKTLELNLNKIESISVDQGLFGRLLNYGTLTIIGSGGTRSEYKAIEKPLEFRATINNKAQSVKSETLGE